MKSKITTAILLLTTISLLARFVSPFFGWERLKAESPEIVVADTGEPTPPTPGFAVEDGPRYDFNITVLSTLKGTNGVRHARLQTDCDLRPRKAYLFFGSYKNGIYKAYEDFKVVPLGITYKQEMIAGKPLDEQIHILFQLAIDNLNSEIANKEAEKKRLETGLQK
jgi:hypothetical protein